MTPDLYEAQRLKTFRSGYISPGDLVYIPAGTIFCEKAVGGHNLALRCVSVLMTSDASLSTTVIGHACPQSPGSLIKKYFFSIYFKF